ncbi:SGNH/GDSL hydrolase family protein [Curtobacterium sp. C1]|uniref:SGNH/GDSL hydrolase family protein n=1 Tax=Curtobacterium sp. C1 TaxID=2898151 RepID=UPI001E61B271|nr:SGNH/GDSL hydrolase family protein [Curtobacterium sp. C1]UFU14650.1 SGNH/GDSL hydrolase family protein [Curtobacterium sp. C1]
MPANPNGPLAQLVPGAYVPTVDPTTHQFADVVVGGIEDSLGIDQTRSSAYTLGGCASGKTYGNQTMIVRLPIRLPKTVTRMRLHISNVCGLGDVPQTNGPSINAAWVGQQNTSPGAGGCALNTQQEFPGGSGSLDNGGEWVSGWLAPSWDTAIATGFITLSVQCVGTNLAYNYSSNGFYQNADNDPLDMVGTAWTQYGDTPLATWIEYEYVDDGSPQVLFIGDSAVDGFFMGPFGNPPMQNWLGHLDSFPEAWARQTGGAAIIDAFADTRTSDWAATSSKWSRFSTMAAPLNPQAVVLHIGFNDLQQGATPAQAAAGVQAVLETIRANYPNARIFYASAFPAASTNTNLKAADRVTMNTTVATFGKALLDGYFEFTGIYDPASGSNEYARAKYVSADGVHYTPEGWQVMASHIRLPQL